VGGPRYLVVAVASSGLPVSLSSATPSVCTVEESTVSFVAGGTCTVRANQPGNSNYEAAPEVQESLLVSKGTQLIELLSTAPAAASVGGPSYTLAARASSGLPISFSSRTPSVCAVEGSTVSFIAAGTCTIDANQPGDSNYDPAPEAQQSFAVASPPALIPTPTPEPTPLPLASQPLASQPLAPSFMPATPDSDFSLQRNPVVDAKTGAITFTVSVSNPGIFTWLLSFPNGSFGAFSASRSQCSASQVSVKGRCRRARIVFARSALSVVGAAAPGITVTFKATPSSSARKALANALARGRGLPVTALLSFRSSLGGSSVSHTYFFTSRLGKQARAAR
jgi:hypothetical protein